MRRSFPLLAEIGFTCLLAGCLIPEKFVASVTMKADGAYTYKYDGTATFLPAAMQIKGQGPLSEKDEQGLKQEANKMAKVPGIQKASYFGAGRYDLAIERDLRVGESAPVLKVISVTRDKEGVYTIAPAVLQEKDKAGLRDLGIRVDGKFEVRLPSNAQVISHNASGTPGLFSKAYVWNVGSIDANPNIRFRL